MIRTILIIAILFILASAAGIYDAYKCDRNAPTIWLWCGSWSNASAMSDPPDTMDATKWERLLEEFSLQNITDTSAIWIDPLPDSTVIALRLALVYLTERKGVNLLTDPIYIPMGNEANYIATRRQGIALIKRVLKAWEAR